MIDLGRREKLIRITKDFVRDRLAAVEGGHDYWHAIRVWQNALIIAEDETVDLLVVELAALLHDIADAKFHHGDEEIGATVALEFLHSVGLSREPIKHIIRIIRNLSFRGRKEVLSSPSKELQVVQDADRLDAIGAIGVARAFSFGGHKGNTFFDPAIAPDLQMSTEKYKKGAGPTINHFYEKLLLLKDLMNTEKARELAEPRHAFLQQFLDQFFAEWDARNNL